MASLAKAPSAVRARRALILCPTLAAAVVAVVAGPGCGHKRSAMRPVFVSPSAATAAPCPTGANCGGSASSSVVVDGAVNSRAAGTPAEIDPVPPEAGDVPTPSRSNGREPGLRSNPASGAATDTGTGPRGPEISGPSASRDRPRRSVQVAARRSALQDKVRPFVAEPDALFAPPKADRPWSYVVIHHSSHEAGSYDEIDREHRKSLGTDGCGYHFVIGNGTDSPDGAIEIARRWTGQKPGMHTRNAANPAVNQDGIGICLVGDLDGSPPTARQVAAARALVAYLSDRYQIGADRVGTHADFSAGASTCPGKNFPREAILGVRGLASR